MPSSAFIQRPLVPLALVAFLGCLAGSMMPMAFAQISLGIGLGFLGLAYGKRSSAMALPVLLLATFLIFTGRTMLAHVIPKNDIGAWAPRRDVILQGKISVLLQALPQKATWTGIVACQEMEWHHQHYPVSGQVKVIMPGDLPPWNPGDEVQVRGQLYLPEAPHNPGEFNYPQFLARKQVRACLKGWLPEDACQLRAGSFSLGQIAGRLNRWLSLGIQRSTPQMAGLVQAMAIGDRSGLTRTQSEFLATAGLAHLLAVSGMNVGVVLLTVIGCLRLLRVPQRIALGLGILSIFLMALATGAQISVIRATWMATGMVLATLFGRTGDSGSGLALAGIIILVQDPLAAQDIGFQLSFAATAGILMVWPILVGTPIRFWIIRRLWQSLLLGLGAFLMTAPLTLFYFYAFTPIALLTNLIAIPLADLIVVGGLFSGLGAWLCLPLAQGIGWLTSWAAWGLEKISALAAHLPGSRIFLFPPPAGWVIVVYVFLTGLCCPRFWKAGLSGLIFCCLLYPFFRPRPLEPEALRLTFLSLNIGEATLVETGDGKRLLLDTGTETEFLWRVKPFLASRGINQLDGLLLSHEDSDHAGGAAACLTSFYVRHVLGNQRTLEVLLRPSPWFGDQAPDLRDRTELKEGDHWRLGQELTLDVLWPPAGNHFASNRAGLAVWLVSPAGEILFLGDTPGWVEKQWGPRGMVEVLKAGHHGDEDSNTARLLQQVRPRLAVVMPGNHNPFGLPDEEAMQRLRKYCVQVFNTRKQGAVEVTLLKNDIFRWRTWDGEVE